MKRQSENELIFIERTGIYIPDEIPRSGRFDTGANFKMGEILMSFIVANFNLALSKESENAFKSAVGLAVELIGQSEKYTLLQINESKIYLRGRNDSKIAYIL